MFGHVTASVITCESIRVDLDKDIGIEVGVICHTLDSDTKMIVANIATSNTAARCVVNG